MYSPNIIVYTIAILSFLLSFAGFYLLNRRNEELAPQKNTPFLIFLPIITLSFTVLFWLLPSQIDFVYPYDIKHIITIIVGGAFIYFSSRLPKQPFFNILITMIFSVIVCLLIPNDFILFPQISPLLSKIILGVCLFVFSYFYPITNNIDTLTTLQTLLINLGIFFLSLIGGAPILLGAFSLSISAICLSFLVFNRYPAQLSFITAGCQALGFISGTLMIHTTIEGSGVGILIFSLFFWVEFFSACFRKLLDWKNHFNLNTYTSCYQANLSGFPPYTIAGHILRLQIVLLALGIFAIYSPEGLSLPIFSIVITIWYISKIKNWQTSNKTIRELNNDLMNSIKDNINELKEQMNKDKK